MLQGLDTAIACCSQALLGPESPAKRTRLSAKSSPSKEGAAVEAKRAIQSDDLEHDVKQVMDYADEKVLYWFAHIHW